MTVYLLPAPTPIAGLLPAPQVAGLLTAPKPEPRAPAQALPNLSDNAWLLLDRAADFVERFGEQARYFPVHTAYAALTDELLLEGLFRKHPAERLHIWYTVTDEGFRAARQYRQRRASHRVHRQQRLVGARSHEYELLERQLVEDGYLPIPEPGRGPELGEVGFFAVDGERRRILLKCRLGTTDWRHHDRYFYSPLALDQVVVAEMMQLVDEIPL